ncbi:MAG: glycosyltransferase, partial [Nitrospinota bacterium]|nr:glycosyltransferase [Nitrospinota bacterium]
MSKKIPISVAIVTKNERENVQYALDSVKDFEDIVVVDAFSNDGTVDLCKKYTDRVF